MEIKLEKPIYYLTIKLVNEIHHTMIELYGGMHGIRDQGLLEAAVEAPKTYAFGHEVYPTFIDKAGAYAFGIIKNHAYIDGNKRTACTAALTFLDMNGVSRPCSPEHLEELAVQIADGRVKKDQVSKLLQGA